MRGYDADAPDHLCDATPNGDPCGDPHTNGRAHDSGAEPHARRGRRNSALGDARTDPDANASTESDPRAHAYAEADPNAEANASARQPRVQPL